MDVFFRADSGHRIGSGHIMRCLNLSSYLSGSPNVRSIQFICTNHENNICSMIPYKKHMIEKKEDSWLGNSWEDDVKATISILSDSKPILIIDQYAIDESWQKMVRLFVKKIVVLDELFNRKHCCDILIDQSIIDTNSNPYTKLVPTDCTLLLGYQYPILNSCFLNNQRVRKSIQRVHIFFGGSDHLNITEKVLKRVTERKLDIEFDVVIGPLNKNYQHILETYGGNTKIHIHHSILPSQMAELMIKDDIALGSSGMSSYERCVLGLFSLVINSAQNQVENGQNLHDQGIINYMGLYQNKDELLDQTIDRLEEFMKADEGVLESLSNKCIKFIDGKGAYRIVNEIFKEFD